MPPMRTPSVTHHLLLFVALPFSAVAMAVAQVLVSRGEFLYINFM